MFSLTLISILPLTISILSIYPDVFDATLGAQGSIQSIGCWILVPTLVPLNKVMWDFQTIHGRCRVICFLQLNRLNGHLLFKPSRQVDVMGNLPKFGISFESTWDFGFVLEKKGEISNVCWLPVASKLISLHKQQLFFPLQYHSLYLLQLNLQNLGG